MQTTSCCCWSNMGDESRVTSESISASYPGHLYPQAEPLVSSTVFWTSLSWEDSLNANQYCDSR
jgi:hypothetical protein